MASPRPEHLARTRNLRERRFPVRALVAALAIALSGVVPAPSVGTVAARSLDAAVAPAATGGSLVAGAVDRTSMALRATYDADVTLSFGGRALRGHVTIGITNTSGGPIDRVELNTIAARVGGLRLGTVTVDGREVAATVDDQTIVVPLGGVLPAGATVDVRVPFRTTIRSDLRGSNWLYARANGIVSLHRWLPWISRRTRFDRPNHGDPFVTPVTPRVTVRITTDRAIRFATTGRRIAADGLTQTFQAENVRDFVLSGAPDYRTRSVLVGDTRVRVWYRSGAPASTMLDAARRALERMEQLVGPYPYPDLDVAQSAGGYGMEGPGIVWIPTGVGTANLRYLVTHEVAHQWFYGVVGNDQAREPFADEAAADFLARYVLGLRRGSRCSAQALDRTIYRYTAACYYEVVYIQGGNLLDDTRRRIGTARFFRALRSYIAANRFGIARTRSLLQALDDATTLDLSTRFGPRFPTIY